MYLRSPKRSGATVVESAVVYPATFLLLLSLVIGAMGVFRYQEVASLARGAARYASTHGAQFRKDCGLSVGSPGTSAGSSNNTFWFSANPASSNGSDTSWTGLVYDAAIRPNLVGLETPSLAVKVGWPPVINQPDKADNWPGSRVSVTVSYQWLPGLFGLGPINLTSTSTMAISN